MSNIVILYSSVHGHTRKICDYIQHQLQNAGHTVTLATISEAPKLATFDKVIIGASIRHGKHNPALYAYIDQHKAELEQLDNAFFSVSLVARKPAKNTPNTNPYMQAFLQQTQWQPKSLAVFAGRLNYPDYNFFDRNAIRFIMWLTKGPTNIAVDTEFTDWASVDDFTKQFTK